MKSTIILLVLIYSSIVSAQSQAVKMDTYSFGEGINLTAKDGHKLKITCFIQPTFESKIYTVGEESAENRFRMRRARVRLEGETANNKFSYRLQFDLTGNGEFEEQNGQYLNDAVINYNIVKNWTLSFGQRSTFTDNREILMLSNSLQFVDRSRVASAFAAIREFGFFIEGRVKTGRTSFLKPYFVLTNGDGGNVFNKDFGGLKIGGRLDFLPFGLFNSFGQFRQGD